MPTLAEIRARPGGDAYADMSDQQLADAVYGKFYSDLSRDEFNKKIGLGEPEKEDQRPFTEKLGNFFRNVYENPPPTVAGIRDTLKGARGASMELVNPASPESAAQAAGTMLGAATLAAPLTPALRGRMAAPTPTAAPVRPPSITNEAVEAAGRIGVDIPKYLATDGTAVPQAAAGIKNIPMAGEPIIQSAQKLTEQMGRVKNELIPGARSPEIAGGEAKEALGSWIKEGSKKPVSAAYRAVDGMVDPEVMVPLTHTAGAVDEIIAMRVRSRIPGGSKAADTVLDAIRGPMDYEGIKGLRTFLGERTPQEMIASGINPIEHKRIYAALTKDLENVVREAGGADALFAWRHANTLARLTSIQRNMLTKITGLKGDAAPEAVFSKIAAYAGSKSSADIGKLRLAKRTMGPKTWDEVGSAFLSRLGSTPDGEFSAARFVTGFSNISPAAKKEIFKPEHLSALNDLFMVSKHIRDRIDRFANPSGTSRSLFTGGAIGGLMIDPISLVSSMVGGRVIAEALSRPAVVKAAANVGRAVVRRDPVMTRAAVDRLSKLLVRGGLVSGTSLRNPRQENISTPPQLSRR